MIKLIRHIFKGSIKQFKHTSIRNKKYFPHYQIENIDFDQVVSLNVVKDIMNDEEKMEDRLTELVTEGKIESFIDVYIANYKFSQEIHDFSFSNIKKIFGITIKLYMKIGKEISNHGWFNPLLIFFYELKEYIIRIENKENWELFKEFIIGNQDFDFSEELNIMELFVSEKDTLERTVGESIADFFNQNKNFELKEMKQPFYIFYTYTKYKRYFADESVLHKLKCILEFEEDEFFKFVQNHLVQKINSGKTYNMIKLSDIMANEKFKGEFLEKVNSLSEERKQKILDLIDESIRY